MYAQVEKSKENKGKSVANSVAQKKGNGKQGFGFVDNRPEAFAQKKLQKLVNNGPQAKQSTKSNANVSGKYIVQRVVIPLIPTKEELKDMGKEGQEHEQVIINNVAELQNGVRGGVVLPDAAGKPLQGLAAENIFITGHGCESDIANYSAENIFRILGNLGLEPDYAGTIVLVSCNTLSVGIDLRKLLASHGYRANVWGGKGEIRVIDGKIWDCKDKKAYNTAIDEAQSEYETMMEGAPLELRNNLRDGFAQKLRQILAIYHMEIPL